jgi:D-alanyl-D-alanine dipeptidase
MIPPVLALALVASQHPHPPATPASAPARWLPLIGTYVRDQDTLHVLENGGCLFVLRPSGPPTPLTELSESTFMHRADTIVLRRDGTGRFGRATLRRLQLGPADGGQLRLVPVRPVPELLREVRASGAQPPHDRESNPLPADLVELVRLDSTIHLDVRYATTNNFLSSVFYPAPRAFLQRPAAEALARVHRALRPLGYGLVIHDGYRPWYVTKVFWDATPPESRWLVANPARGSKHNRGAAVDLTLYELASGHVVEMPSTYDEATLRAAADFPGGTARERWHRALLRRVMEAEGFVINPSEWWHFDYRDWQRYPILNVPFEDLGRP